MIIRHGDAERQDSQPFDTAIDAALAYHARGWAVVPLLQMTSDGRCVCGQKKCKPGKHPAFRWKMTPDWTRATPTELRRWYDRYPTGGIGLLTGSRSGLCVIDVDTSKGGSLDDLLAYGSLPETYSVQSGSNGLHLYFAWTPGIDSPTDVLPHIDVRGENGLIVAPPSPHVSGGRYTSLNNLPVAQMPFWLERVLLDASERKEVRR